jgi:predicted dehydrogenase
MHVHTVGIILNGVTGRMGTNQHLVRSILAIREQGGVKLGADETIMPRPILVGRNADKLKALCDKYGLDPYTTDLDSALADSGYPVYFDALTTNLRVPNVRKAIAAGKHVYVEKPIATNTDDALAIYREAVAAGVKHGVVQDKLWLPGILKLKYLLETGYFGRILAVRGEFGYWVFDGLRQKAQRPSWNYRKEDGGGILIDMFSHWRYVLDNLFGPVKSLIARAAIHIDRRADEQGNEYEGTADDAAYGIFELRDGIIAQFNSSWCTRVRRDDLLTIQVDGTDGSAVAGLRECWVQHDATTPKPVWNPDVPQPIDFRAGWERMPDNGEYDNAFKAQWELFLKHVVRNTPFPWDLLEGAKGVQLAELGRKSSEQRTWVDVPELG